MINVDPLENFSYQPVYDFFIDYPYALEAIGFIGAVLADLSIRRGSESLKSRIVVGVIGAVAGFIIKQYFKSESFQDYEEKRIFKKAIDALARIQSLLAADQSGIEDQLRAFLTTSDAGTAKKEALLAEFRIKTLASHVNLRKELEIVLDAYSRTKKDRTEMADAICKNLPALTPALLVFDAGFLAKYLLLSQEEISISREDLCNQGGYVFAQYETCESNTFDVETKGVDSARLEHAFNILGALDLACLAFLERNTI